MKNTQIDKLEVYMLNARAPINEELFTTSTQPVSSLSSPLLSSIPTQYIQQGWLLLHLAS